MSRETEPAAGRLSYTVDEALQVTGMQRTRFYAAIASGELKSFKHGRRRFVSNHALRAWIETLERQSAPRACA